MEQEKTPQQIIFEKELEDHLLMQDWTAASELIVANKRRKRNHGVTVPHPIYGKITALEASIIYDHKRLWDAIFRCFPYGNGFTAENKQGFSHSYLAILHNTSFRDTVLQYQMFDATNQVRERDNAILPQCFDILQLACIHGHLHVAEFVLQKDLGERDKLTEPCSRSPLQIAALYNHYDMCRLLLSYNDRPPTLQPQCDLGTAMHIAARFGFEKVIKSIVTTPMVNVRVAVTEADKSFYMTALGLAVYHLHYEAVKELIAAGSDVNIQQGIKKLTPLQLVLSVDCKLREEFISKDKFVRDKIVLLLLNHGASTDPFTPEQLTYIEELKQRQQAKVHVIDEVRHDELIIDDESEEFLLPDTEAVTLSSSPSKNTPPKRKAVECHLCNKKFTSEISLQAHLKSKSHLRQVRKQKDMDNAPEVVQSKQKELMEHLPLPLFSELWFEVFNLLDLIDLRQLSGTCKSIRLLVDKHGVCWRRLLLWSDKKNADRVLDGTTNVFEDVMHRLPNAKGIIYVQNNRPYMDLHSSLFAIPRECRQLEVLNLLNESTLHLPVSFLNHLFENCPNLRVLRINSIWPYKPSKISAVQNGELDVGEQPPTVNPKKPWKVKKTTGPKIADWLVDFKVNLPAIAHKLEYFEMMLTFNEPKITPEQYLEFYIELFKHLPNIKILKLYIDSDHQPVGSNVAAHELYKNVLVSILEICPKITELLIGGAFCLGRLSNEDYDELFRKFGQLEKLELAGEEMNNFNRDMSHYIADYCTKLTTLKLDLFDELHMTAGKSFPYSKLTRLQHFQLRNVEIESGQDCLFEIIRSCSNLTNLNLDYIEFEDEFIEYIALLGTKLQSLKLPYSEQLNFMPLVACTNLTRLNIGGMRAAQFHQIMDKCHKLTDIKYVSYVPEPGFGEELDPEEYEFNLGRLLNSCTNLTRLEICEALISQSSFDFPVFSTSLKVVYGLSASKNYQSDLPLFYLSECCPNLSYIHLGHHMNLTNASEHILTTRFPKLVTFYTEQDLELMLERVNEKRLLKLKTEFSWHSLNK